MSSSPSSRRAHGRRSDAPTRRRQGGGRPSRPRPGRAEPRPAEPRSPTSGGERIQKILSAAGVCSRRAAEELIAAGRVHVDGRVASLGDRADARSARIEVDGERIAVHPERVYLALNKPAGVVTTLRDPQGRPTVRDLLKRAPARVVPVGRLDAETHGLLLLTNDGDLAHRLMHPRWQVPRVYVAEVRGEVSSGTLRRLRDGVQLDDGPARATDARVAGRARGRTRVELTMTEGRKREVRRMLDAVGHPVVRLARVRFGPISLGGLPAGRWRALSPEEVGALLRSVGL